MAPKRKAICQRDLQPACVHIVFDDDLQAQRTMPEQAHAEHDEQNRMHRLRDEAQHARVVGVHQITEQEKQKPDRQRNQRDQQ